MEVDAPSRRTTILNEQKGFHNFQYASANREVLLPKLWFRSFCLWFTIESLDRRFALENQSPLIRRAIFYQLRDTSRLIRITIIILLSLSPTLWGIVGWFAASGFVHPHRRQLTPDLVQQADRVFNRVGASREEFALRAPDGIVLRGWKVPPGTTNGNWILLFHGIAEHRTGVIGHAEPLLGAGYGVVMMDSRAHGESEGPMATYGWIERNDTQAIVDALDSSEHPDHLFAFGESMGAGIALQSAAIDSRIEAVVAEASFASLREASYDYAGLRWSPLLGRTLFVPFSWALLHHGESLAGFSARGVSPEDAVATRPFSVLLICDEKDVVLPCRHMRRIYAAARGPKELWVVPEASHTGGLGVRPAEFKRRVLQFYKRNDSIKARVQ